MDRGAPMTRWLLLLGCAAGNPWIYLSVWFTLTKVHGVEPYANLLLFNGDPVVNGLAPLGLLIYVPVCLVLAVGLIWLKHQLFRWRRPEGAFSEYASYGMKALSIYGFGALINLALMIGVRISIFGFIILPLSALIALMLFLHGLYDLVWSYRRRAGAASALEHSGD